MNRLKYIEFNDLFRLNTILDIIHKNSVLITTLNKVKTLINHYSNYDLMASRETNDNYLYGIPMRKSVDKEFKHTFKQMFDYYIKINKYLFHVTLTVYLLA